MNCYSLELKIFSSHWGLWLVFKSYKNCCTEGCHAPQREGNSNPRLHATLLSFKMSVLSDSKGKWQQTDLQVAWCSVYSTASDPPVHRVWAVAPIWRSTWPSQITLFTMTRIFYVNTGLHSTSTNSMPVWCFVMTAWSWSVDDQYSSAPLLFKYTNSKLWLFQV
jgi:hypothetical protein